MKTTDPGRAGPPPALARILSDDAAEARRFWDELRLAERPRVGAADAAAASLLATPHAGPPGDLARQVMARLPAAGPPGYAPLVEAVLAAWTDPAARRALRADPAAILPDLGPLRVVGPDEGRLPRPGLATLPLPADTDPAVGRRDAVARLAKTDFGWLLASEPGVAESLGLLFPAPPPARGPVMERLRALLGPRPQLRAAGLGSLALGVALTIGLGGGQGLVGAAFGVSPITDAVLVALSLALGAALLERSRRP